MGARVVVRARRGTGLPWPARRESEGPVSGAVDESAGQAEQAGADGAGDRELAIGAKVAEVGG